MTGRAVLPASGRRGCGGGLRLRGVFLGRVALLGLRAVGVAVHVGEERDGTRKEEDRWRGGQSRRSPIYVLHNRGP